MLDLRTFFVQILLKKNHQKERKKKAVFRKQLNSKSSGNIKR